MRRYILQRARHRSCDWQDDYVHRPDLTVYEPIREPRDTGLVDRHGMSILSIEEREPIGFVRFAEHD